MQAESRLERMDYRKVGLFILIAYGLTWTLVLGYFGLGGTIASPWFVVVAVGSMFMPAVAAVLVQRVIYGAPLAEIGLTFRLNRWFVVAAVVPVVLVLASVPASALMPGASLTSGMPFLTEVIRGQLPPEEAARAIGQLEAFGRWLPLVLLAGGVASALVAGATINAVPALGEELGWRGLLQAELAPLGFWRASLVVGLVWGVWHAPLILQGYNYPGYPVLGVAMMVLLALLLSPLIAYAALRAGSAWAAAVFHGVFNALAALPTVFVAGGTPVRTGMTGAAGLLVLLLADFVLFVHLRRAGMPSRHASSAEV